MVDPLATTADDSRYEFQRKLGEGASGAVYLVRDRETGEVLALKQLHRADDRSIARLKREFRSLTNVLHRNVVRLYDLGRAKDTWFVTMEYLAGKDLTEHLYQYANASTTLQLGRVEITDPSTLQRVLATFLELAQGVRALHRDHVLHRDLKPSNVIVTADRVVVVDFGLALEVGEDAATVTLDNRVAGTPAYMAPEQLQMRHFGEANDWYSFGVMLYEAIAGELPIDGSLHELLRRKLETDPTPIERMVAGVPTELARLTNELLDRDFEQRPSGDEVIATLQRCLAKLPASAETRVSIGPHSGDTRGRGRTVDPKFVGREDESLALQSAFDIVQAGGFQAVHVSGVSGSGKSALVEHFFEKMNEDVKTTATRALLLRGRCYERETVPFKALDAIIDALVTQLKREDDFEVSFVMPQGLSALTQIFHSLTLLPVVQRLTTSNARPIAAAPHSREEAESALRELCMRLGKRRSLVIFIDDLHWGDLDSARIIRNWMEPPGIPGMMLVLSYRSDEVATSPCLRSLLEGRTVHAELEQTVALGPLSDDHIRALCMQRFASSPRAFATKAVVDHIVHESGGSPFLASQLATLALTDAPGDQLALGQLTIEALVSRRTSTLSSAANRLLNVLSVASRPLSASLALRIAGVSESGRAALHELSSSGLIRTRESQGERLLSVYHDRLREGVLSNLSAEARASLDRQLLLALQQEGTADAAWLHSLALGSGDTEAALRYGRIAAAHATAALAFEHAAELYRSCLKLSSEDSPELLELWQKLAVALGHAGHGKPAAAAYVEAAKRSDGVVALQFQRRAASHLLRSGHFEEGEALVGKVLKALKLETPQSNFGLLLAIGWERLRLAWRGLKWTERHYDEIPLAFRFGGVLCGELSIELQPYAPLRAALFQARSLRIALDAGIPHYIARALCVAATVASMPGTRKGTQRAAMLLDLATNIERKHPSTLVRGNISSARAVCAMLVNRMEEAVVHAEEAERRLRDVNSSDEGEYYHRFTVLSAHITALLQLGRPVEAREVLQHAVNEARATENIAAQLILSNVATRFDISDGRPERGAARLEAERHLLPKHRFGLLHMYFLSAAIRVGCAMNDYDWTIRFIAEDWDRFQRSLFRRAGYLAVIVLASHARLVLNRCVATGQTAKQAAAAVAKHLRQMKHARGDLAATAAIERTRARLDWLAGKSASARSRFEASVHGFEKVKSLEDGARSRWAMGVIAGKEAGAQDREKAIEVLRAFGHVDPYQDLKAFFPELLHEHATWNDAS